MRLTRPLLLLALAALTAPRIEASRTSVWESNPPATAAGLTTTNAAGPLAPLAPAGPLESIVADVEPVGPLRFDLGDVVLVESPREERFRIGLADVIEPPALRGPPLLDEDPHQAFKLRDPETRIRGLELLPPFRIGASPSLSLWPHQACGFSCREVASDSRYDPWGLQAASDPGLPGILAKLQAATDEAARRHGIPDWDTMVKSGDKGVKVNWTLVDLLNDRSGPYYDPRILTEVQVDTRGVIRSYGARVPGEAGSVIKDIVVLEPSSGIVSAGRTRARDVTKLVLDLKVGKKGARLRQFETVVRYGVPNVKLRPHQTTTQLFRGVAKTARAARMMQKAGAVAKFLPVIGKAAVAVATGLSLAEAGEAMAGGDLDHAAMSLTGLEDLEDAARWIGDQTEAEIKARMNALGASGSARSDAAREVERTESNNP